MMPALVLEHQAVQGGEGAQGLHKRRVVAQTAPAAPEIAPIRESEKKTCFLGLSLK